MGYSFSLNPEKKRTQNRAAGDLQWTFNVMWARSKSLLLKAYELCEDVCYCSLTSFCCLMQPHSPFHYLTSLFWASPCLLVKIFLSSFPLVAEEWGNTLKKYLSCLLLDPYLNFSLDLIFLKYWLFKWSPDYRQEFPITHTTPRTGDTVQQWLFEYLGFLWTSFLYPEPFPDSFLKFA